MTKPQSNARKQLARHIALLISTSLAIGMRSGIGRNEAFMGTEHADGATFLGVAVRGAAPFPGAKAVSRNPPPVGSPTRYQWEGGATCGQAVPPNPSLSRAFVHVSGRGEAIPRPSTTTSIRRRT
jgi:hypothetical protein